MTDRELLELAAKAANKSGLRISPPFMCSQFIQHFDDGRSCIWSPLSDDLDAIRLAHHIGIYDGPKSYEKFHPWMDDARVIRDDPLAAFRQAIVCYAAEIGKAMP